MRELASLLERFRRRNFEGRDSKGQGHSVEKEVKD